MKTLFTVIVTVFMTVGTLHAMGWLNDDAEDIVVSWSESSKHVYEEVTEFAEDNWDKLVDLAREFSH